MRIKVEDIVHTHPEVKELSLLMLLYAGNTYAYKALSCNYSILNIMDIVKILQVMSQSAGNSCINIISRGTSETIRNNNENIKLISNHVPTHLKPLNDEQFGHYLAGLIDSIGHFNIQQQLVICFNLNNIQLAYYIKKYIKYGSIYKIKNKDNTYNYNYILSNNEGILRVIHLINGKLRTYSKYTQVINYILNNDKYNIQFNNNTTNNILENHWLAGFTEVNGNFIFNIQHKKYQLTFDINLKTRIILDLIKSSLGGNISYHKIDDSYYYSSTSFGSAKKYIQYFDKFHLQGYKYRNYLQWRKVYLLIQNNKTINN